MLADTDAIRDLGSATSTQAADLAAVALTLSSLPDPTLASTFGPVGARFLAALADATAREAQAVTALSDSVAAACPTAFATATAYGDADHRVGNALGF
jgi:hypothetical protein